MTIPPLPTSLIAERIARAVRETGASGQRTTADVARGELPPVPEAVSAPVVASATAEGASPGANRYPLDEVANQLARAREKIAVPGGVPGWLRPFYRNQGGFNFVLLETLERLLEANRQLEGKNQELRQRVMAMSAWMNNVAQTSRLDHEWMSAVDDRLRQADPGRLVELETRLAALERERTSSPCAS